MPEREETVSEHTPGPWKAFAARKPDNTGSIDYCILDVNDMIIAEAFQHVGLNDRGGYSSRPAEANAHLIAAAPDLLESLKAAVAWLDSIEERLGPEMINLLPNGSFGRPTMLQAIAKAEGRKPCNS